MYLHSKEFDVKKMAKIFAVSRAGYYKHINKKPSKRKLFDEMLISKITAIYNKSHKLYGSPRVHAELKKRNEPCSRKKVATLMKINDLKAITHKRWKHTKKSQQAEVTFPNYMNRNFFAEKANTAWVSDITQVKTNVGWLYIAAILDLYSRKIVGLSMSKFVDTELVAKAFLQAICHRAPTPGLIIHSDRGSQYLSKQYKSLVEQHGVLLSTSARGSCYDNAAMESFFGTLKTEHVYRHKFSTREEAMLSIFEYVEVFYNRQRIHSTLGYLSPAEFEAKNMFKEVRI